MNFKRFKYVLLIFCISLSFAGCSYVPSLSENDSESIWTDSGAITIGNHLTIQNRDNRLTLLNNIDTLSADGLYYASWCIGDSRPYENSDGDTVDLYDAQLYLLLGEFSGSDEARNAMNQWLAAGKTNYEILSEEENICNGQTYTFITYNCISTDNPYDHGISAFCVNKNNAVCIELTCLKDFPEDLKTILLDFLNGCSFNNE